MSATKLYNTSIYHNGLFVFIAQRDYCDICVLHNFAFVSYNKKIKKHIPVFYRSFVTRVSQLKICDFSGEPVKGFEGLHFYMGATTTKLLSSGEFCKLRYDTTPIKSASANVSFYNNNSKKANFEL